MATTTHMTIDEFLKLPETEPAGEYSCGDVRQKPMPDDAHAAMQLFMGAVLYQFLTHAALGRARTEWRCIFGPPGRKRAYIPDLVFLSNERMPKGNALRHRYLRTAPDLAIEILSPKQSPGELLDKVQFYLMYGVRLVWVVDPLTQTVTVLRPESEALVLGAGDTLEGGDVLPGFSIPVDDIFAQLQI